MEFATIGTEVGQVDITGGCHPPRCCSPALPTGSLTAPNCRAVRRACTRRCAPTSPPAASARPLILTWTLRSHLARLEMQDGIAKYLAREIAELTIERRAIQSSRKRTSGCPRQSRSVGDATCRLSKRRGLSLITWQPTTISSAASQCFWTRKLKMWCVLLSLGTTEQGDSGTQFRVDYLKPSGAIGFYHPDWVVVQKTEEPAPPRRRIRGMCIWAGA